MKYTSKPEVTPLKVTGAALRSMKAADQKADEVWERLENACQKLGEARALWCKEKTAHAARLVLAAVGEVEAADKERQALVPRHIGGISTYRPWIQGDTYHSLISIRQTCVDVLHRVLTDSGIPHPAPPANLCECDAWCQDLQAIGVE